MRQISTNVNLRKKRTGTSVDDLKARGKDQIRLPLPNLPFCHRSSQMFDLRAPLSNDVPVMLLNRPIYVFQLGCRNLVEVRNQKFKIQKTTEIISYNRWINCYLEILVALDFTSSFTRLLMTFVVNKPSKLGHCSLPHYCTCTNYNSLFQVRANL